MSPKHPTQGDEAQAAHSDVYRIAEEVVERSEDGHMRRCENDPAGPVCKVIERIGKMEARLTAIEECRAEERGAAAAIARATETSAKKIERYAKIGGLVAAIATVANIILSHWPHR